jgi:ammonium transporter, Amt family
MLRRIFQQRRWFAGALALTMFLGSGAMAATDSAAKKDSVPAATAQDSVKKDSAAAPAADTAKSAAAPAAVTPAAPVPDPNGSNTGDINAITAAKAGEPTLTEIGNAVGHNIVASNMVWTLVAGFLVMFMQAGFALVETGFCRGKNASHTMFMNFSVYFLGMTGFFICGYALMMGNCAGVSALGGTATMTGAFSIDLLGKPFQLFGTKGFFLMGDAYDVGAITLFLFEMVFMDTAVTIPTGAMAERWKTTNFVLFSFFMSMFVYPIYGNWVWGNGWLAKLGTNFGLGHGHVDYAGSSVVHMVGGVAAFAGALVLGPRIGKFTKDGKPNAIPGHHIPMAILGTMILGFGWFGFNAGSSLAANDLRISIIATNTMLASASGGVASMIYMYVLSKKFDPTMVVNGFLAGLVAITAPCAFVNPVSAFVIGAIAGVLVIVSCFFIERTLKIDDPVGAISVHGVNGAWGVLSLGLFADGTYGDGWNGVAGPVKGLFYGDASQFAAQCVGTLTNFVWVFGTFFIFFKVCDVIWGIRVSKETEVEGLDIPETGVLAYNDFTVAKS